MLKTIESNAIKNKSIKCVSVKANTTIIHNKSNVYSLFSYTCDYKYIYFNLFYFQLVMVIEEEIVGITCFYYPPVKLFTLLLLLLYSIMLRTKYKGIIWDTPMIFDALLYTQINCLSPPDKWPVLTGIYSNTNHI